MQGFVDLNLHARRIIREIKEYHPGNNLYEEAGLYPTLESPWINGNNGSFTLSSHSCQLNDGMFFKTR